MKLINGDKLVHTDNSEDVIEHFGIKGMKWGQRIRSAIERGNARAENSTRGLQRDWQLQRKYNKAEWKAVQKRTRKSAFSPLTNDVLKRQQGEYAKLKSYKDTMNDVKSQSREFANNDYMKGN